MKLFLKYDKAMSGTWFEKKGDDITPIETQSKLNKYPEEIIDKAMAAPGTWIEFEQATDKEIEKQQRDEEKQKKSSRKEKIKKLKQEIKEKERAMKELEKEGNEGGAEEFYFEIERLYRKLNQLEGTMKTKIEKLIDAGKTDDEIKKILSDEEELHLSIPPEEMLKIRKMQDMVTEERKGKLKQELSALVKSINNIITSFASDIFGKEYYGDMAYKDIVQEVKTAVISGLSAVKGAKGGTSHKGYRTGLPVDGEEFEKVRHLHTGEVGVIDKVYPDGRVRVKFDIGPSGIHNTKDLEKANKLENSIKASKYSRYASTDEQETSINNLEKWAKALGLSFMGGTTIGKSPQTVILDINYQGSEIYINSDGTIKVFDDEVTDQEEFKEALVANGVELKASIKAKRSAKSFAEHIADGMEETLIDMSVPDMKDFINEQKEDSEAENLSTDDILKYLKEIKKKAKKEYSDMDSSIKADTNLENELIADYLDWLDAPEKMMEVYSIYYDGDFDYVISDNQYMTENFIENNRDEDEFREKVAQKAEVDENDEDAVDQAIDDLPRNLENDYGEYFTGNAEDFVKENADWEYGKNLIQYMRDNMEEYGEKLKDAMMEDTDYLVDALEDKFNSSIEEESKAAVEFAWDYDIDISSCSEEFQNAVASFKSEKEKESEGKKAAADREAQIKKAREAKQYLESLPEDIRKELETKPPTTEPPKEG
jgi:hypothetical protein